MAEVSQLYQRAAKEVAAGALSQAHNTLEQKAGVNVAEALAAWDDIAPT